MTRVVGSGRALALCLTGDSLSAAQAQEIGLLHEILEPDVLMTAATERATKLAKAPPAAVASIIESITHGMNLSLNKHLELEVRLFQRVW